MDNLLHDNVIIGFITGEMCLLNSDGSKEVQRVIAPLSLDELLNSIFFSLGVQPVVTIKINFVWVWGSMQ